MAKILIIDDDADLVEVIRGWLQSQSHIVESAFDGADGLEKLRICSYDVVILDWELPEPSGIEILHTFRNEGGVTPVIMLTGRRATEDKTGGLDGGADDYMTKPVNMQELSSRIRAAIRRSNQTFGNTLKARDIELDPTKHTVTKGGQPVQLLPKEFALLEFLMRHPGDVFSTDALLQRVWHSESEATVEAIRTCVKRIRQKIDADDGDSIIETLPRIGYRLKTR